MKKCLPILNIFVNCISLWDISAICLTSLWWNISQLLPSCASCPCPPLHVRDKSCQVQWIEGETAQSQGTATSIAPFSRPPQPSSDNLRSVIQWSSERSYFHWNAKTDKSCKLEMLVLFLYTFCFGLFSLVQIFGYIEHNFLLVLLSLHGWYKDHFVSSVFVSYCRGQTECVKACNANWRL